MHLGELVQITISYTRELRKHYMKTFTRRMKSSQCESKRNSQSQLSINGQTFNEVFPSQISNLKSNDIQKLKTSRSLFIK
jgi:hypothetical protein